MKNLRGMKDLIIVGEVVFYYNYGIIFLRLEFYHILILSVMDKTDILQ